MNDIIYREATREDTEQLLLHLNTVGGETDNLSFGKDTFLISKEKEAKFIDRFSKSETDVMYVAECDGKYQLRALFNFKRRVGVSKIMPKFLYNFC